MSEERSDFLSRLAARARGEARTLAPRLPGRWEAPERLAPAQATQREPGRLREAPVPPVDPAGARPDGGTPATKRPGAEGAGPAPHFEPTASEPATPELPGLHATSDGPDPTPGPERSLPGPEIPAREIPDRPVRWPTPGTRRHSHPPRPADALLLPPRPALPGPSSPPGWPPGPESAPPAAAGGRAASGGAPVLERHLTRLEVPVQGPAPQTPGDPLPLEEVEDAAARAARELVAVEPSLDGDPVVHVHVGRVEVQPAPPPAPPPAPSHGAERLSLDDYLERRAGRWR